MEALPKSDRYLPDKFSPKVSHRWEDSYPENIGIGAKADLLSDPPRFSDRGDRWNMDHVWFSEEEMRLWIPENMLLERAMNAPRF